MNEKIEHNKEQIERNELHKNIWKIADEVRGAVDGWDFKQYILGILFYRFISENINDYINKGEREVGDTDFNYADLIDEQVNDLFGTSLKGEIINEKGFFIYPSQLYSNIVKNAHTNINLNKGLDEIFKSIEASAIGSQSEDDIKGLFDDLDTTSTRLGGTVDEKNKRLTSILKGINQINFNNFQENGIDAFGDAYEFLISNYASNAGKSGGEYFTPQSVSKLLARIVMEGKDTINKVYDPTCGSGSLLLQMKKQFDEGIIEDGFFGQEINPTNYNLGRMNMFLHNINYDKFSIVRGDTLLNPQHQDRKPFDAIVSNPPYSIPWIGKNDPTLINDERFAPAGVLSPNSKADYAFIMHALHYLSPIGTAAIVCFPGIFYRNGAEQKIRKYLVDNNFIDTIISLPSNLFFGTSIATYIMVLSKNKRDSNILFIDAANQFKKETNNNILEQTNIDNIVNQFSKRETIEYFTRLVSKDEVANNNYNLSVNTYVKKEDLTEKVEIEILNKEIEKTVKKQNKLRKSLDQVIKDIEGDSIE